MAQWIMRGVVVGLQTVVARENTASVGYGGKLPPKVQQVIFDYETYENEKRTAREKAALVVQALVGVWLVVGLMFHMAEVGLIGL